MSHVFHHELIQKSTQGKGGEGFAPLSSFLEECPNVSIFFIIFRRFGRSSVGQFQESHSFEVVRSTLLQVGWGRQIGLGWVPPADVPGPPLTNDISGSS